MKIQCESCQATHELEPPAWVVSSGRPFRFRCSTCGYSQMVQPPAPGAVGNTSLDDNAPLPPPSKPDEEQTTMVTAPRLPRDDDSEQTTAIGGVGERYSSYEFRGPGDLSFYDQPDVADAVEPSPTLTPTQESDELDASAVYLKQDGKVYMVRSWQTLCQWIREQRVSREDLVSEGGVRWSPIGSRPEAMAAFQQAEGPDNVHSSPREQTTEGFGAGPLPFDNDAETPFVTGQEDYTPAGGLLSTFPRDEDTEGVPLNLPDMRFAIPPTLQREAHGASTSDSSSPPVQSASAEPRIDPNEPAPPALWEDPDEPAPPALWEEPEDSDEQLSPTVIHEDVHVANTVVVDSNDAAAELGARESAAQHSPAASEPSAALQPPPSVPPPSYNGRFYEGAGSAAHAGEVDSYSTDSYSAAKARQRAMLWMLAAALLVTGLVVLGLIKVLIYPPSPTPSSAHASASIGDALPPEHPTMPAPPRKQPAEEPSTTEPTRRAPSTPAAIQATPAKARIDSPDSPDSPAEEVADPGTATNTPAPATVPNSPFPAVDAMLQAPPLVSSRSTSQKVNVTAQVNRGWADLERGDAAAAERTLRIAVQAGHNSPDAHYAYGYALIKLQRLPEAATHICKARTLSPDIDTKREVEGLIRRYEFICNK